MDALNPTVLHVVAADDSLLGLYQELKGSGASVLRLAPAQTVEGLGREIGRGWDDKQFDAIALYSHGSAGEIHLGAQATRLSSIQNEAGAWASLGSHLKPNGDLLLYGCEVAATPDGEQLVHFISNLTGADVAASIDRTGHQQNWTLEYQVGQVQTDQTDALTGLAWSGQLSRLEQPVRVPLHWIEVDHTKENQKKLGLYATVGGGSTPQFFEFDTGGNGFYATYAAGSSSPWWGDRWTPTGEQVTQSYDSGNTYEANVIRGSVSLFGSATDETPLLTADDVVVGQTTSIINTKKNQGPLWPLPSTGSPPPVNGAFYGDFGMAPKQGQKGIDSLSAQLEYGDAVTPGFRVHASGRDPWVQFGLSPSDIRIGRKTFTLNPAGAESPHGVPYYQNLVMTGELSLFPKHRSAKFTELTGLLLDTGASTNLHLAHGVRVPSAFLSKTSPTRLAPGLSLSVRALSQQQSMEGKAVNLMTFKTGDQVDRNQVELTQSSSYYLNTGILPFLKNDIIYNLEDARLTLAPRKSS